MHEIETIKGYIEKVFNTPSVEQGIKDRVILYLQNLLKRKIKLTVKDRWTKVEDKYLQKMAGVFSLEEVYKKFSSDQLMNDYFLFLAVL